MKFVERTKTPSPLASKRDSIKKTIANVDSGRAFAEAAFADALGSGRSEDEAKRVVSGKHGETIESRDYKVLNPFIIKTIYKIAGLYWLFS